MNNTVLAGLIVGAVVVTAAGAIAVNSGFNPLQKYATVVDVQPAFDTHRVPRQVCGDEALIAQATSGAGSEAAAAVPPADAAPGSKPAAPAPQGARQPVEKKAAVPAEEDASGSDQEGAGEAGGEEDCVMVYDTESVPAGFDVTYELDGVQRVVRMDQRPGERIPVEGGELVLSQS